MRPSSVQTREQEWERGGLTYWTTFAASPSGRLFSRTTVSGPGPGQTGTPSRDQVRHEVWVLAEQDAAAWRALTGNYAR